MENTRLMSRLFSATEENDAELTAQVAQDIEAAHEGRVETDELVFEDCGDGKVAITDKENGEVTVAEKAEDGNYDLSPWMEPTAQPEAFIHPEEDGVTPGNVAGTPDEDKSDHLAGAEVSDIPEHGVVEEIAHPEEAEAGEAAEVCPECGKNPCECSEEGEEEPREFSVATDNTVVQRIFSDQAYCERLFSEVIESEESAKVGNLKIDKLEGEDAVVVTDTVSGDQAKVELDDENLNVTELDSKEFSEEGVAEEESPLQYEPLHVVGVDVDNHVLVDAPEFEAESAEELAQRLVEQGVDAVEIFENEDEARDYAMNLLENLGAEDAEEPEEKEFSDHTVYVTRYYSRNTYLMDRMFSEACNDVEASQAKIEDAIENGDQIETDSEIITPVDARSAVVEDKENGEFTKVDISDETMDCTPISEEEADKLLENLEVEDTDHDEDEEGEKEYSDVYCNEEETKFFSETENMTDYMVRLFSEEASEAEIEDAIESGEQIENDTEVITPVDAETAIIEDKENGEFTKAVMDDEKLDLSPITEEEADELTKNLVVEDDPKEEPKAEEEPKEEPKAEEEPKEEPKPAEEEEKKFSTSILDKFFADVNAQAQGVVPAQPAAIPGVTVPVATGAVLGTDGNPVEVALDENGQPVPAGEPAVAEAPAAPAVSVEAIEDKALAAVQSIQAAAAEAESQILNAKAAPAEGTEQPLQEAQFSETSENSEETQKLFSENDTLASWLSGTKFGK